MKRLAAIVLVPLLVATLAGTSPADEESESPPSSPVGTWRLDREAVDAAGGKTLDDLVRDLLVPEMELPLLAGRRLEATVHRPGTGPEAREDLGTWTRSRDVVSLATLRDDGLPGSLIARLQGDTLVIDLGSVTLPLRRVAEDVPPAPPPAEDDDSGIGIGGGAGPSIRLPIPDRDDGAWPVPEITSANRRRVARRVGADVVAALANDREVSLDALWEGVPATHLVHVRSAYDRVGAILESWQVPHATVSLLELLERSDTLLQGAQVVFLPSQAPLPRALESSLARVLRRFVAGGGRVASTGWSIASVLQPAFPELLATAGRRAPIDAMLCIAAVTPSAQQASELVCGLPARQGLRLWVEAGGFDVEPLGGEKTPTLLAADQPFLHHERSRALVVTARHGEGRILHSLPHLDQARGAPRGAHVLQHVFLRFVAEALAP